MTPQSSAENRVVVAVSGASGSLYAEYLVRTLLKANVKTYLIFSKTGERVLATELCEHDLLMQIAKHPARQRFETDSQLASLAEKWELTETSLSYLKRFPEDDFFCPVTSGSLGATHMVICPASMGCLGRIAHGISSNVIERTADVMLKEKRPLIVVPRETPFNLIHLRNLTQLCEAGASIVPAMPGFYHRPQTVDEVIRFVVERVLASLKIQELDSLIRIKWNEHRL